MRTKTMKWTMAVAIAIAGLAACTSNELPVETQNLPLTEEGEPTYATFTFKVSGEPDTRSDMLTDENETTKVTDIRLLVYDMGDSGRLRVDTTIDVDNTLTSPTVMLTSGQKRILVIANAKQKSDIRSLINPSGNAHYPNAIYYSNLVYDLGEGTPPTNIDKLSNLVDASTGYVMTNAADNSSIFIIRPNVSPTTSQYGSGESDNHFSITIQRTVAKVTIYYEDPSIMNLASGTLQDLKYNVGNVNRSLYLFQQTGDDNEVISPNNQSSFYDSYIYRGYGFIPVLNSLSGIKAVYVTENIPEVPNEYNTTHAAIEATFVPKPEYVVESFNYNSSLGTFENITHPATITPGTSFYLLRTENNTMLFTDSQTAHKAAYCLLYNTESGFDGYYVSEDVKHYVDGKCYYIILIKDSNDENAIIRNHHYRIKLTGFIDTGINAEEYSGEMTITQKTYATASISIAPWIYDDSEFGY
ncbi:MAG: Mfa1 family fimbria major subunit [Tannerellaceae bacterium]|nr:Mfa1 family fimbria major subunit [Tannerellaceae bacterium]